MSEVAVAARSGMPARRISSGTATIPPPTPKKAENTPATRPMATRRTVASYEHRQSGRPRRRISPRAPCSSDRGGLAPEYVPGEPDVVLGRPEVADGETENEAVPQPRVREKRLARPVDPVEEALVVLIGGLP